jgi:hypothetical protein
MMLHKFRRAMVKPTRESLWGEADLDDTWVRGSQTGLRGSRQLKDRKAALVLVAIERRGQAAGRARLEVIPDFKSATRLGPGAGREPTDYELIRGAADQPRRINNSLGSAETTGSAISIRANA